MTMFPAVAFQFGLVAQTVLEREAVQSRIGMTLFFLLVAVVLLAIVVARVIYRERRTLNSPRALFGELCRAHGIDAGGRRLLTELARSHNLSQPTLLFVQPDCFETGKLSAELRPRAREIEALAERLFVPAEIQA